MPQESTESTKSGLLGLGNSNRDFSVAKNWGKNQFNSAFPAALGIFMHKKDVKPVYITLDEFGAIQRTKISVEDLYGINPLSPEAYYAFEEVYEPYKKYVVGGRLPRVDLVIIKKHSGHSTYCRPLEIKLTALPDEMTSSEAEVDYGCELVVRPDTIVYLAISIAKKYATSAQKEGLRLLLEPVCGKRIKWQKAEEVLPLMRDIYQCVDSILSQNIDAQEPLLMQPVWKTQGTSPKLHDNCLDIFVWSEHALVKLFLGVARGEGSAHNITRHRRAVIWLVKMLHAFSKGKKMNAKEIIDKLTYKTKNDKAFSVSGEVTREYMRSQELLAPRVQKDEIKRIVLGGGEKFLRPERRFDSAISNTPGLF